MITGLHRLNGDFTQTLAIDDSRFGLTHLEKLFAHIDGLFPGFLGDVEIE